ncbi:hypothetical protein [Paracoccus sp. (in: a-proteobacteria)]|uniref:hypothetical protein n=1 Tax=Paracoccus sp. TaxID=267 RepID=UPI0028A8A901|nr:hypothetical protein [Paracoccus sp. (in: a-proteobacteria)]
MDFTSFDSRSVADEGRPLHLKHPATGEPLFDGEAPCVVHVLGTEGRIAQEAFRDAAKLPKLADDTTMEEYHARLCITARKLIVGFANVDRGDRPATPADADWFLGLNMTNPVSRGKGRSFAEQVLAFSGDRGEYLGKPEASLSGRPARSAGKTPGPRGGRKPAAKT